MAGTKNKLKNSTKNVRKNYDSPWKTILDQFLQAFLDFCLPDISSAINWHKSYRSLDKELLAIVPGNQAVNRTADKLYSVWLKSGEKASICLHLEVQSQRDPKFELRMLTYHYRILDKYQQPVISIAILTDKQPLWRPSCYQYSLLGCQLKFDFRIVKLLDFKERRAELLSSGNPFGFVILAHLTALEKFPNDQDKLERKTWLTYQLYDYGWTEQQIKDLFQFLDWMVLLPPELDVQYSNELKRIEESKNMKYITSVERVFMQKGMQEGMQKGMQEGMQKGVQEGMQKGLQKGLKRGKFQGELAILKRLIQRKFKILPSSYQRRLEKFSNNMLLAMADKLLEARSLEDLFETGK